MRDLESSLQAFAEFLLKGQLVRHNAAPYFVRWVRRFLSREATSEALVDQVRRFCDDLERAGHSADWQVRQAEQALRLYFVDFLQRTGWSREPASTVVDGHGGTNPLAAREEMRRRLGTRHAPTEPNAPTSTGCVGFSRTSESSKAPGSLGSTHPPSGAA